MAVDILGAGHTRAAGEVDNRPDVEQLRRLLHRGKTWRIKIEREESLSQLLKTRRSRRQKCVDSRESLW